MSKFQPLIQNFYSALNANEIERIMSYLDPEIERVEFEGSPNGGRCQGLSELKAHFEKGRSTWAEGSCTPKEIWSEGDKLVARVHVYVRLKDKTDWIDGTVFDAFQFKNEKLVQFRSYLDKAAAFEWAGMKVA